MGTTIDDDEVFVETSVLVDLAQQAGQSTCFPLFKEFDIEKVVSPYVEEEYGRKKENRESIVKYYQRKIGTGNTNFDDLSLPNDENLSESDLDYAEDLLDEITSMADEEAVMKELADRRDRFRKVHRLLFDDRIGILKIFVAELDPTLSGMLRGVIGNRDDEQIICEAADWANTEDTETVLSLDREDMVENEDRINEVLDQVRGFDCELAIYHATTFISRVIH